MSIFASIYGVEYLSFEAAHEAIDDIAKHAGFSLVIKDKKPNAINPKRVTLRCAKGRPSISYANEAIHESKRRKTSSQMSNCRYQLAVRLSNKGLWGLEVVKTLE